MRGAFRVGVAVHTQQGLRVGAAQDEVAAVRRRGAPHDIALQHVAVHRKGGAVGVRDDLKEQLSRVVVWLRITCAGPPDQLWRFTNVINHR